MARWSKITKDVYEKGNHYTSIGYNPISKKYIVSFGNKSVPKSIKRKIVVTKSMATLLATQYRKTH